MRTPAAGRRLFAQRKVLTDIKFGPYIHAKGVKKQIYLVAFIDDATRYIVHAEFYENLGQAIVEDCLKKAIIKEGLPSRLYFDNGGQFRNRWMERACAMLGIKLLFAKPYSPEGKGKVERFNRTVDAFFAEAALQNLSTLCGYNHYLDIWVSECYHRKTHSALKDTPENVYQKSKKPLRFAEAPLLAEAFLHHMTRKVDKAGCISIGGQLYEASMSLVGHEVEILFDPMDKTEVTVRHQKSGFECRSKKLVIGPKAAGRPKLPDSMLPAAAASSRLLDAKSRAFDSSRRSKRAAIRYSALDTSNTTPDDAIMQTGGGCRV